MAYFNGFPSIYQPVYSQYQQPMIQNQNQQNGVIWVQGEAGAKSYMVAPNQTVQLWDSEDQVIYLKSADASGMPQERPQSLLNGENYVTKEEFLALREKVENWLKSPSGGGVKNEQSNL